MTFIIAFAVSLVGVLLAQGLVKLLGLTAWLRLALAKGNTVGATFIFIAMTLVMTAVMTVWWMMVLHPALSKFPS